MNLLNSIPYRNINCEMSQLELIYKDLENRSAREAQRTMGVPTVEDDLDAYKTMVLNFKTQYIKAFKQHLNDHQVKFVQYKDMFKPMDYIIPLGEILFSLIEKNVKFILVNSPENSTFLDEWNKFRMDYALNRLLDVKRILKHLERFLVALEKGIKQSCPPSIYKDFLASNGVWKLLKETLSVDVDFLRTPVSFLTGLCKIEDKSLKVSAEYLFEANNFFVDKCLENLPWVLNKIEKILKPFENLPQDEMLNFSKILLERIKHFKEFYLPKISSLYLQDNKPCSAEQAKFLASLKKLKKEWSQEFEEEGVEISERKQDDTYFTRLIVSKPTTNFLSHENILKMLSILQDNIGAAHEKKRQGKPIAKGEEYLDLLDNPRNAQFMQHSIGFHKALHVCDALLQTYFYENVNQLDKISTNIYKWYSNLSDPLKRKIKEKPRTKEVLSKIQAVSEERTVEELMEDFDLNEIPKTKPQQRSKRKKPIPSSKKRLPSSSAHVVQSPREVKESHAKPKSSEQSIYDRAISLLFQIKQNSEHLPAEDAIQQAYMYLQDLGVAHKALSKSSDPSVSLFYLISVIQSAYFTLEQLIRYQAAQTKNDIKVHNLIELIKEADLESKIGNAEIINELFSANYWVRQHDEQLAKRKSWTIPPVLMNIKEIYEAKDSRLITKATAKINTYIHSIPQFICKLPALKKTENLTQNTVNPNKNVEIFKLGIEFDKKMTQILNRCESIYTSIPYHLQPKFKQVISHLKLVSGIFHEFGQNRIPSDQFGFLIRSLIFWENTVLEEILETLHSAKTGNNLTSHHLDTLWKAIPWLQQPKEKHLKFLEENFYNVHNISRYPFSFPANSSHPLHKIILRGEALRERPELGLEQPYQLSGGKSSTQEDLTPQAIGTQIQKITHKVMNIIEKRLLPEFEALLANSTT